MSTHSFDVQMAVKIGVEKAIIYKEFCNIYTYKKLNKLNEYDGCFWFYYSSSALSEKMPYLNQSSIKRWVRELEEDGYIRSSQYNKDKRDRTKWFTLNNPCIDQNGQWTDQNGQCNIKDTTLYTSSQSDISKGDLPKKIETPQYSQKEQEENFRNEIKKYTQYPENMLEAFFLYWSEWNNNKTPQMKYEEQKTWELHKRLATWNLNNSKYNKYNMSEKKETPQPPFAPKPPSYFNNEYEYQEYLKTINHTND